MQTKQEKCFENAEKLLKEAYREILNGLIHESECQELKETFIQSMSDVLPLLTNLIQKFK